MFFGFSDRADKNGDGRVDMWEAAEELYAYDSIMGTNISGFCPENDEYESNDSDDSNSLDLAQFNSNINTDYDSKIVNKLKSNKRVAAIIKEAKTLGKIMGITVSWSLEESMFTAKSMKARGYNATERTSYLSYKFSNADFAFIALIIVTVGIIIIGLLHGVGMINIYPSIDFKFSNLPFNIYYLAFILFLLPLIYLEIKERILWH